MEFEYEANLNWPRMAWVASARRSTSTIRVLHGPWVETRDDWFAEATWDGDFVSGGFDEATIVAGTGGRIRGDVAMFVPSSANVDRLHRLSISDGVLVSNSLAALMSVAGARPRYDVTDYAEVFAMYRNVILAKRVHTVQTSLGPVDLIYNCNLAWNGHHAAVVDKPQDDITFDVFEDYESYLLDKIGRLANNAGDAQRVRSFGVTCPLSRGYDSPAVAALASRVTNPEAITILTDRAGKDDSGVEIAQYLGIPCHTVERNAWRRERLPEVPFIACSGGVGDLALKGAEPHLESSLVLTGLGGDVTWERDEERNHMIAFGDGDQLGLMEFRQWAGFLVLPVPLIGIQQFVNIRRINHATSMDPWDIPTKYSKPIARRIAEEAGVPREAFGGEKSGLSEVPLRADFLLPESWNDFYAWLSQRQAEGATQLPNHSIARGLDRIIHPLARLVQRAEQLVAGGPLSRVGLVVRGLRYARKKLRSPYYHHRYLTHWGIERAIERYDL